MFELQTARLRLIASDVENLRLSLDEPQQMEKSLGLRPGNTALTAEVKEAVQQMLADVLQNQENWLWHTLWQIVLKEENRSIGGFCFKGPANENGEVEVGYGVHPAHQGKGYMTEALLQMASWALEQEGVRAVVAESIKSNIPSAQVLEKAGFARSRETDQCLWWKLEREHQPLG